MGSLKAKRALIFVGIIMVILTSITSFTVTRQQVIAQNKAVIGKLYEKDSEACKLLVEEMFETEATEKEQIAGEKALSAMGYTKEGAKYLYLENGLGKLHFIAVMLQVLLILGICVMAFSIKKPRMKEEEMLISDIRQSVKLKKSLDASKYSLWNKAVVNEIAKVLDMLFAKENELQKKTKNTQNFVENVAHQIKTPLACASISLDLLLEQLGEEKQAEYVNRSFRYLKEIELLMKKILDIGRLETEKLVMKKEAVQLETLLGECMMLLDPERKRLSLECKADADLKQEFFGDYEWLKEAFSNILKNSMEHDKSGKTVEIKLIQRKENIFVQIRDHGTGIANEDLKHIFDRFYIPNQAKKSHTGIGLNLAELVIKKHFGIIEVHNHEEGGAVFSILLPTYGLKNEKLTFS